MPIFKTNPIAKNYSQPTSENNEVKVLESEPLPNEKLPIIVEEPTEIPDIIISDPIVDHHVPHVRTHELAVPIRPNLRTSAPIPIPKPMPVKHKGMLFKDAVRTYKQ